MENQTAIATSPVVLYEENHTRFPFGIGPVVSVTRFYSDGHKVTLTIEEVEAEEAQIEAQAKADAIEAQAKAALKQRQLEDAALTAAVAEKTRLETTATVIDAAMRIAPDLKKNARATLKETTQDLQAVTLQIRGLEVQKLEDERTIKAIGLLLQQ